MGDMQVLPRLNMSLNFLELGEGEVLWVNGQGLTISNSTHVCNHFNNKIPFVPPASFVCLCTVLTACLIIISIQCRELHAIVVSQTVPSSA